MRGGAENQTLLLNLGRYICRRRGRRELLTCSVGEITRNKGILLTSLSTNYSLFNEFQSICSGDNVINSGRKLVYLDIGIAGTLVSRLGSLARWAAGKIRQHRPKNAHPPRLPKKVRPTAFVDGRGAAGVAEDGREVT